MAQAFGYFRADSATAHRYVASQYNAGAGAPVRKDIGVQPVALSTARVHYETILNSLTLPSPPLGARGATELLSVLPGRSEAGQRGRLEQRGQGPQALPSDAESIEVAVLSEGLNSVGLTGSFDVEK